MNYCLLVLCIFIGFALLLQTIYLMHVNTFDLHIHKQFFWQSGGIYTGMHGAVQGEKLGNL